MSALEFFNPAGATEVTRRHAARLAELSGRRIGFVSNGDWQAFRTFPLVKQHLEADYPDVEALPVDFFPDGTDVIASDRVINQVLASGVDAVILGNAACGGCSTACGVAAGRLEAAGVPTVTITREDFTSVVRNAVSGLGLPGDLAMVPFPIDLFLPDSDLAPLAQRRGEIYAGLTSWATRPADDCTPTMFTVEGRDHDDALRKANDLILANGWGDGLPLWPATAERVEWILRGTDLPRDQKLGRFPPRGGHADVEACAIALAMAGGRPEYLPVLIAAVEALLDPAANSEQMQATSAGTFPVIIVNGPIGKDIRMNSGFGCLGPVAQRPAGALVGRALRLLQQNLGGAQPGTGTMAPWGAMRFTNAVFAEDEDGLPDGWLPHGTARHGFARGSNSLSFFWGTGVTNVLRRSVRKQTLEEDVRHGLHRMAEYLGVPNVHYAISYDEGTPGAVLLTRVVAAYLAATGWTQESVRQFLWEHSAISRDALEQNGVAEWISVRGGQRAREALQHQRWPITATPDNIILAVAGGAHPTHACFMQAFAESVIGREISLPTAFDRLLSEADRDLGCGADACRI